MTTERYSLKSILDGWDTYQTSIVHAVKPLTAEQLRYRPAPNLRSAGEVASHIALCRVSWFERMDAPGSRELMEQTSLVGIEASFAHDPAAILHWLEASWKIVGMTLSGWTTDDLARSYVLTHNEKTFRISFQWTIWRVLAHDLHHGGELGLMLGMQGIAVPELGDLGGHLNVPPLA